MRAERDALPASLFQDLSAACLLKRGFAKSGAAGSGSFGAARQIGPDRARCRLIILFYLIQHQNGIFRNVVSLRAKQFRQLTCRGSQLIKTEVCADTLQRMRSPKRFLPLSFLQCAAQFRKAAVIQKFGDEFRNETDTWQPRFYLFKVTAQFLITLLNCHPESSSPFVTKDDDIVTESDKTNSMIRK